MERHELRELVEDALEALKPRYQRTRTPLNLQTIREEVEDQHGAPLATPRKYQASCSGYGSAAGALSRQRMAASGGGSAIRRRPSREKYDRSIPSPPLSRRQRFASDFRIRIGRTNQCGD